jgi:hypothetical protein
LQGVPDIKEIAERLRQVRQNTDSANGEASSASKMVDKAATQEIALEQKLARVSETLLQALKFYDGSYSAEKRDENLQRLNADQAKKDADEAILASDTILQKNWLDAAVQDRLKKLRNTADERRTEFAKKKRGYLIPRLPDKK